MGIEAYEYQMTIVHQIPTIHMQGNPKYAHGQSFTRDERFKLAENIVLHLFPSRKRSKTALVIQPVQLQKESIAFTISIHRWVIANKNNLMTR
jgi:hypothetical protein